MTTVTPDEAFRKVLVVATKTPGVFIDRDAYLRGALAPHCTGDQIERAIADSPPAAGVAPDLLERLAGAAIKRESAQATALSAAAGLPGGLALIGAVPVDLAQYLAHMIRVAQKLAYLYGWPSIVDEGATEVDDETTNVLILFLGVMGGVSAANMGVSKVADMVAVQVIKKLPAKALTKGTVYPIVKSVAKSLGVQMSKQIFSRGVAKVVPVVGAAISGGLTYVTFTPMAKRLKRHLSSSVLAQSGAAPCDGSVADSDAPGAADEGLVATEVSAPVPE